MKDRFHQKGDDRHESNKKSTAGGISDAEGICADARVPIPRRLGPSRFLVQQDRQPGKSNR